MKTCSQCKKSKTESEFYKKACSKDGLRSNCKQCVQKYAQSTKDRKTRYDKQYYLVHKEGKDKLAIAYYHANKQKKKSYDKQNRSKVYASRKERYRTDLNYKLTCNLRSRLYSALRRNTKSASTFVLLGCSVEELKKHIGAQFTEGMSWDRVMNGEIHIDHIKPCASFDLSKVEEQRLCFHYSNLQPLWAKDNFKKSKGTRKT